MAEKVFGLTDDFAASPTDAVGSMTKDIGGAANDTSAADFGKGLGFISIFSSIKNGFETVVQIYETFKHLTDKEKSRREIAEDIVESVSKLVDTASSVLSTVDTFFDIISGGGVLPTSLVPGLGIVVSGISLVKNVISTMEGFVNERRAQRMMSKIEQTDVSVSSLPIATESKWYKSKQRNAREARKAAVEEDLAQHPQTADSVGKKKYRLLSHLEEINRKRVTRGAINITSDLLKIIGNITNIVAGGTGVGAAVGTSLGAGGSMLKLGAKAVRNIKQFGRNHAWSGFDTSKTSAAKKARYEQDAAEILDMIRSLPAYDTTDDVVAKYKEAEQIVRMTGVRIVTLLRHSGDPDKQKEDLIEAMKKREK